MTIAMQNDSDTTPRFVRAAIRVLAFGAALSLAACATTTDGVDVDDEDEVTEQAEAALVSLAPSTPRGARGAVYSSTAAEIFWEPSKSAPGSRVTGYAIFRNGRKMTFRDARSFFDPTLTPATKYEYRIYAIDSAGRASIPARVTLGTPAR